MVDLCDGQNLECTFRRTVDDRLYMMWLEIVQLTSTIVLGAIWQGFSKCFSNGFYRSPAKPLTKNGFQAEAMEKPFCNLYYVGEAKNSGFPRLLPHM
jgi:hypothetical protein